MSGLSHIHVSSSCCSAPVRSANQDSVMGGRPRAQGPREPERGALSIAHVSDTLDAPGIPAARTPAPDGSIPVSPKFQRRFYEPLVLLKALICAIPGDRAPEPAESHSSSAVTDKQAFHTFVYKLAQVCDSARYGSTVSSFAVLEQDDKMLYVCSSNNRKPAELDDMKVLATSIIQKLKDSTTTKIPPGELSKSLLRDILKFNINKKRLTEYLLFLRRNLNECLDSTSNEATPLGQSDDEPSQGGASQSSEGPASLTRVLEEIRDGCPQNDGEMDQEEFLNECEKFLARLSRMNSKVLKPILEDKVKTENVAICWKETRHFIGRLLSMYGAVDILVQAPRRWERLFWKDFEVQPIPSSRIQKNPLGQSHQTVSGIIGRMTSDKEKMAEYRGYAAGMQELEEEYEKTAVKVSPMVHSEILLADWLDQRERKEGEPPRFFNGWKYIGSSKPSCRLCSYFFEERNDIEVRPSHRNVYVNWRMPDLFAKHEERQRNGTMCKILDRVREDAFHLMREQQPQRKKHDSVTSSFLPQFRTATTGAGDDGSDLTSLFGGLTIDDRRQILDLMKRVNQKTQKPPITTISEHEEDQNSGPPGGDEFNRTSASEHDEEEGGASLG